MEEKRSGTKDQVSCMDFVFAPAVGLAIIELIFCFALGMAVLPCSFLEQKNMNREVYFFLTPVIGFSVWLLSINFLSLAIQFSQAMSLTVFALLAGWIIYKRENLFFLWDRYYLVFIGLTVIFSVFIIWGCQNPIIDGGIYFHSSAYDHSRIAVVDSIVRNGFPLYTPWVTDNGNFIPLAYHFGIHTLMAQCVAAFTLDSLLAASSVAGLICMISIFAMGATTIKLLNRKAGLLFLILLCLADGWEKSPWLDIEEMFVTVPINFGFWAFMVNAFWTQQHLAGGAMVLTVIIFAYDKLNLTDSSEMVKSALLTGVIIAASAYSSVYAGGIAAGLLAVTVFGMSIFDKDFRGKIINNKSFFGLAVFCAGLFVSVYLAYILQYLNKEVAGIGFGLMPRFTDAAKQMNVLLLAGVTYFVLLPLRIGIGYTLGFISCLIPRFLPETQFVNFCKYYVFLVLAIIFVFHSNIYSNDFGWRMPTAAFYLIISFGTVCLYKLYTWVKVRNKTAACLLIVAVMVTNIYFIDDVYDEIYWEKDFKHELHKEYADVIKGWKVVQDHTDKNDLVLCNPNAYRAIHLQFGDVVPNYHFSYYAKRYSPMGDYVYAKTSAGAVLSVEQVIKLHQKVTSFFAGSPTTEETDYIADVQKVKALLVTPQDGLYYHEGALRSRYPRLIEGKSFKVYLTQ